MSHPPRKLLLHRRSRTLELDYGEQGNYRLDSGYLRFFSPSAETRGHDGKHHRVPENCDQVSIVDIQAVGNYSVRLIFDDGHDSGIYSWEWLYDLALNQNHHQQRWQEYLHSGKKPS